MTHLRLVPDPTTCAHCRAPLADDERGAEHCESCGDFFRQLELDAEIDRDLEDELRWCFDDHSGMG